MSEHFEKVKGYYDAGLWNKARVHKAVEKGWITAAEYREITGEKYK
ncbi:MAG: XkdX family protein [Oscillospiraceae bacterium]|nr:XkdX family protein [Oscillospiraceae bacterium]